MSGRVKRLRIRTLPPTSGLICVKRIYTHKVDRPDLTCILVLEIDRDLDVACYLRAISSSNGHVVIIGVAAFPIGALHGYSHAVVELCSCGGHVAHGKAEPHVGHIANVKHQLIEGLPISGVLVSSGQLERKRLRHGVLEVVITARVVAEPIQYELRIGVVRIQKCKVVRSLLRHIDAYHHIPGHVAQSIYTIVVRTGKRCAAALHMNTIVVQRIAVLHRDGKLERFALVHNRIAQKL